MARILVIGSVHIDILADVDPSTTENLDKVGRLKYSVGGTAFNVAANLAFQGKEVAIYSALKDDSFSAELIRTELERRGLATNYVRDVPMPMESGFVAHTQGGNLITAVSCIAIQDISFEKKDLLKAIRGCSLVAIECNLARDQIQQIARLARDAGKPLCVCAVSESKVDRIYRAFEDLGTPAFRFVILNDLELKKATGSDTTSDAPLLCKRFSTEYIVVTRGRNGFAVLNSNGKVRDFNVAVENVVSAIGAGDALYAALCSHFSERSKLDPETIVGDAKRFLVPVLGSQNATPELPKRSSRRFTQASMESTAVGAIITLLASVGMVVYGLFGPGVSRVTFGSLLFGVSMMAGIAGTQIERLLVQSDPDPFSRRKQQDSMLIKSALGLAAGLVAGLLFFLPQIISNKDFQSLSSDVPFQMLLLLPFCLIVGFIGGLTADSLLRRARAAEASRVEIPKYEVR